MGAGNSDLFKSGSILFPKGDNSKEVKMFGLH